MKIFIPIFVALIVLYGFVYQADKVTDTFNNITNNVKDEDKNQDKDKDKNQDKQPQNQEFDPNEYVISPDGCSDYYFNILTKEQQNLYNEMVKVFYTYNNIVDLKNYKNMDLDDVTTTYYYVLYDHPELFWLDASSNVEYYEEGSEKILTNFTAKVYLDEATVLADLKTIYDFEEQVLPTAQSLSSEYEKVLYIYEYLIENLEYNIQAMEDITNETYTINSERSGELVGALVDNTPVCSGYSDAFTYLLNQLGIECFSVVGEADGTPHQWNMAKIGMDYYLFDLTWGDPVDQNKKKDDVSYLYFAVTTAQLEADHAQDTDKNYPLCNSTTYNYFYQNNLVFADYTKENVGTVVEKAIENGETEITVLFENTQAYQSAQKSIFYGNDVKDILANYSDKVMSGFSYSCCDPFYAITLYVDYKSY